MAIFNSSTRYYRSYYRLVALAVIVMMMVLSGSLLLGDSVRGTLEKRVQERLGDTQTLVTSGMGFMNEEILRSTLFSDAKGYLLCEGYVSADQKMVPVMVWATDADGIPAGEAVINDPLRQQLPNAEDLVLHLPAHSLVPSGSLFVTQQYSTQLRLHVRGTRTVEQGGNLLLRNEQALPLNLFMNRQELAEVMELQGKINLIMSPRHISQEELATAWNPALSGISLREDRITTDRIFLQPAVVKKINASRLCMAYLVNNIIPKPLKGGDSRRSASLEQDKQESGDSLSSSLRDGGLWYSFVTATDSWNGQPLQGNEVLLSDYAAERLAVQVGDSLSMDYFVTKGMKSLEERSHSFLVKGILPLVEIQHDSLTMTEFPGLSNVERCADWDSDLPIDMDHIDKEDEAYWYAYHQTPKAIVAYDAVKDDWSTPFGMATGLQDDAAAAKLQLLTPQDLGILVVHPRQMALYAANNGTDFSSLFLALGFFIILSGILLMQNPLAEMFACRRQEIELYATLGYSPRRIYSILCREAGKVVLLASPIGILCGMLYSGLTLFLLSNVWSGATHTEGFSLSVSPFMLLVAWAVGMLLAVATILLSIRSFLKTGKPVKMKKKELRPGSLTGRMPFRMVALFLACVALFLVNLVLYHSIVLFVLCGLSWILACGMLLQYIINRYSRKEAAFSLSTMRWADLAYGRSNVWLSFWALAVGVFTVYAVGLNRPSFAHVLDDASVTGGFDLWCECSVPIQYDLNDAQVRQKLHLQELPDSVCFMQIQKHTQDEASCLNLNKVTTPTVLGIDTRDMAYFGLDARLLTQTGAAYSSLCRGSILLDQESLTWSLMKSAGDTLRYTDAEGREANLRIAAAYPTGIFHGNALMDKDLFRDLWPDESGSRILLVRTGSPEQAEKVRELLEIALSEYGVRFTTTQQRIELFFTVTDTYLSIFLTLGGLGLLLGIFSLVIVVRKNLVAKQAELQVLRNLGFTLPLLRRQLLQENLFVPLYAVVTGSIGSLISISANIAGAGWQTILVGALFLTAILYAIYLGIRRIVEREASN